MKNKVITITYLSFNRGKTLLQNLIKGIDKVPSAVQISVLDNSSTRHKNEYSEIERLSQTYDWIQYIRQDENKQFRGNFIDAFRRCTTKYLMLMSDEDIINFDFFSEFNINEYFINKNYSVIRPSVGRDSSVPNEITLNNTIYPDKEFEIGPDSWKDFSLVGTYLSGYIYNMELFKKYKIMDRLVFNINKQAIYPHIYLNLLMGSIGPTRFMQSNSCFCGAPDTFVVDGQIQGACVDYIIPYSHGSRYDQLIAMRDAIFEAISMRPHENPEIFYDIYLRAVEKYFYLICRVDGIKWHNQEKINVFRIANSFAEFALASIELYPMRQGLHLILKNKIIEIANAYVNELYNAAKN